MEIRGKSAVITGAASGIGRAAVLELAKQEVKTLALVDLSDEIEKIGNKLNQQYPNCNVKSFQGDTTDANFRSSVFLTMLKEHGPVNKCIPAAGITRDALSVKLKKNRPKAKIYPVENFRQVVEVNLIAPIYWALEMVAQLAEQRVAISLGSDARQWLAEKGHDPIYGARPLNRLIQSEVRNPLTDEILFGRLEKGGTVNITLNHTKDGLEFNYEKLKTATRGSEASVSQNDTIQEPAGE